MLTDGQKKIRKPKPWKHSEPITREQLMQMRDEFWDTAPHYGGQKGMLSTLIIIVTKARIFKKVETLLSIL